MERTRRKRRCLVIEAFAIRRVATNLSEKGFPMTSAPMAKVQEAIARTYILEAIKNSHNSLKTCWTIVFAAGTFCAASTLHDILASKGWLDPKGPRLMPAFSYDEPLPFYFISFIVFFLTFSRFYIAGTRVFDFRYFEIFTLAAKAVELDASGARTNFRSLMEISDKASNASILQGFAKWEALVWLFQTLIVVFLATNIGYTSNFLSSYCFLLLFSGTWLLVWEKWGNKRINHIYNKILHNSNEKTDNSSIEKSSDIWLFNNLICGVLVFLVLYTQHNRAITDALDAMTVSSAGADSWWNQTRLNAIGLGLCVANCFLDFFVARDLYLPKFLNEYDKAAGEPLKGGETVDEVVA
jgi:hypothetical protein